MHCIKFCFLFILSNRWEKIKTFVLFLAGRLKNSTFGAGSAHTNFIKRFESLLEIRSCFAVK